MKRRDLINKITRQAGQLGISFDLVREGGQHTLYRLAGQNVVIPRHREVNEITAKAIMRDLDDKLGKDWWK